MRRNLLSATATTLTSYGRVDPHRQGDVIACISGHSSIAGEEEALVAEIGALLARHRHVAGSCNVALLTRHSPAMQAAIAAARPT
jgi:hypothetical protein